MAEIVVTDRNYLNLVGDKIRNHRKLRKLTQEQFAETVGEPFSAKVLSRYENGKTEMGISTYFEIAKALGVSPNDLAPHELLPCSTAFEKPNRYSELDEDNKQIINTMIAMLLQKQRKQK